MSNYLIFPMECMNISQGYTGQTSHKPHNSVSPKDYPLDIAGKDAGRDYFLCPCDEMEVKRLYGVGSNGTNTIWLQSTSKVIFADGTEDYCCIMAIHPNDDDLKKIQKGQKFKRGERVFREGTDGQATGNHIHMAVGKGKMTGSGWVQNSNGKWVITTAGGAMKPENAFFVDEKVTTRVIKKGSISFKKKPTSKYTVYTVAKGDSLWTIAKNKLGNGNRYPEIVKLNGLKTNVITVGQKLKLPKK